MRRILRFAGWLALAAAGIFLAVQLSYLGRIWWWIDHDPQSTAFMRARLEQMRERDGGARLRQAWVPYDRISPHLKRAIVVAEDSRFEIGRAHV